MQQINLTNKETLLEYLEDLKENNTTVLEYNNKLFFTTYKNGIYSTSEEFSDNTFDSYELETIYNYIINY